MLRLSPTTLFQRLRSSGVLRVFFALTGLFWMVSASACALHDVSGDCDYAQSVIESHHADGQGDADHVPCCPHPLSIQLLVFQAPLTSKYFVSSGSAAIPPLVLPCRSHSQSPPTPPPILG